MKLIVTPIYGWGWSAGKEAIDTPQPFELEIVTTTPGEPFNAALGKLEMTGHPLAGKWVWLSQRHDPYDGYCNLFAFNDKPDMTNPLTAKSAVSGFASVAIGS